ncbi:hypothetical protein E0H56_03720 [Rhizobium leguminosarum bv. viciae]|uniref:hypothetical protein n=1 Tax=Rhizobium leguminosarum TaxID=384 RepID=UPI00103FACEB|nr:hypothetical protein [Rhizobium leguminosarum]TBZ98226.1 hypothetical protein E0H56_03720 [Rhizobium leguminosarum bv. viciae]
MKMVNFGLAAIGTLSLAGATKADMSLEQMNAAIGLAQVIANAAPCEYVIDQAGLEHYFVEAGFSTPEGLSYINANIPREAKDHPSPTECTLSRSTAKSIGVLSGKN